MRAESMIECDVMVSHHSQPLQNKYGITVMRLTGTMLPGCDNPRHLPDDTALSKALFGLGYSADEIADVIKQLQASGSKYKEKRTISEFALSANGF